MGAAKSARYVAVRALAGMGKSAVVAALAEPSVSAGAVPEGFVQAATFLSESTLAASALSEIAGQLRVGLPAFANASKRVVAETASGHLLRMSVLERELLLPLRILESPVRILIAIDGFDRLSIAAAPALSDAIRALMTEPALQNVTVVVTCRPDTDLFGEPRFVELERAPDDAIRRYLERRSIEHRLADAITTRAQGNWLLARLLADIAPLMSAEDQEALPADLMNLYETVLQLASGDNAKWEGELRPVLAVLAAAGTGPALPIELLCRSSAYFGGPDRPARVRDTLVDMRGFVVRGDAGTDLEHAGLFHQTFADYLISAENLTFGTTAELAHDAILKGIAEIAPLNTEGKDSATARYAAAREADHLWATRRFEDAVESLALRERGTPAEKLSKWLAWSDRIVHALGRDSPGALTALNHIAHWTGESGNPREALRLSTEVLLRMVGNVPSEHPVALKAKSNHANWLASTKDYRLALPLFRGLLLEQYRVLGPKHLDTLGTLNSIAFAIGNAGDPREALRMMEQLVRESGIGREDPSRLFLESNLVYWKVENGLWTDAMQHGAEILPICGRVLGYDNPLTLRLGVNLATAMGRLGDPAAALASLQNILKDHKRVLGPAHPDTLVVRLNIAHMAGLTGELKRALAESRDVLPDLLRVLGPDSQETLTLRNNIANYTAETGGHLEGERLFRELLPEQVRLLSAKHPLTLNLRHNIARMTGTNGGKAEALRLFNELLIDREEVLGPKHPDTLRTRHNIGFWTAMLGNKTQAMKIWEELLQDEAAALGSDHPITTRTKANYIRLKAGGS